MKTQVIQAKDAKAGMVMAFVNERFNYVIEEVSFTREGEVRISSNNDTSVEFYEPEENIWVQIDDINEN